MSNAPKRKVAPAAAEVFRQQNIANFREPTEEQQRLSGETQTLDDFEDGSDIEMSLSETPKQAANRPMPPAPQAMAGGSPGDFQPSRRKAASNPALPALYSFKTSEELQLEKEPLQVRETGLLFWKRIIVPPNVYVVHTRAGHERPVTLGLGISFRYNPRTDAYLIVPAAMQTIGVVSNCISKEKQGINVLAYVQWQISDFSIAYRKLDFSDLADPLGIVNAQLREQADAAIKDKIATMSVEEVLTDKAPVIEELTRRLIEVAEGRVRGPESHDEGLGIKIVTVQIKEAYVSSRSLWENLQAPYRHEQERVAHISLLDMQEDIRSKQLATRQIAETSEAETQVRIQRVREEKSTEALEVRLSEDDKRQRREQESRAAQLQREQESKLGEARADAETQSQLAVLQRTQQIQALQGRRELAEQQAEIEQQRLAFEAELKRADFNHQQMLNEQQNTLLSQSQEADLNRKRQEQEAQVAIEMLAQDGHHHQAQQAAEIARLDQEVRNLVNEPALLQEWIAVLPQLAETLPDVQEMRVLQMGENGQGQLASFLAQQGALFNTLRQFLRTDTNNGTSAPSEKSS